MTQETIFGLLQRSITKPPISEGSTAKIFELDDPAFSGFVLKVMNEVLTPEGKFTDAITPESAFFPLRTGFADAEVGQILLAHQGRRVFVLPKVKGMTLEAQLAKCIEDKQDRFEGAMDFVDKLNHVPAKGYKKFMQDMLLATRLNCGLDIVGNNIMMNEDRLHAIDLDVMVKSDFKPEHFNFIDSILLNIHSLIEDQVPRMSPAEEEKMDASKQQLRDKLEHIADQVGFPVNIEQATQWVDRQRFVSHCVLPINKLKTPLCRPTSELHKVLEKTIQFNHAVG